MWLVDDNGTTETFREYKGVKGDQKNPLFALLSMEDEEVSYSRITRNESGKKNPKLKFTPQSILTR